MGRPWSQIEASIRETLLQMAWATATQVSTNGSPPAGTGGYQVSSDIYDSNSNHLGTGSYTSNDNMHAEIAAIGQLGVYAPGYVIKTNKEPCYRCAAVLAAFRVTYQWTVVAPKANAFAATYSGGYAVPDAVLAVVIARLVALGAITAQEGADKKDQIRSFIASGEYKPKL